MNIEQEENLTHEKQQQREAKVESVLNDLLNCLFYGGEAMKGIFSVWCKKCGVHTKEDVDFTEEQIIAKWNCRCKHPTADVVAHGYVCKECGKYLS